MSNDVIQGGCLAKQVLISMCVCVFASVCCHMCYCVYISVYRHLYACTYIGDKIAITNQADFPIEGLATGLARAPKGCQVHKDSPTLIKPTKISLIILNANHLIYSEKSNYQRDWRTVSAGRRILPRGP